MGPEEIKWVERIVTLENTVKDQTKKIDEMTDKLDELLELKSKGMGAFWLASAILGTGIVGVVLTLLRWSKGVL